MKFHEIWNRTKRFKKWTNSKINLLKYLSFLSSINSAHKMHVRFKKTLNQEHQARNWSTLFHLDPFRRSNNYFPRSDEFRSKSVFWKPPNHSNKCDFHHLNCHLLLWILHWLRHEIKIIEKFQVYSAALPSGPVLFTILRCNYFEYCIPFPSSRYICIALVCRETDQGRRHCVALAVIMVIKVRAIARPGSPFKVHFHRKFVSPNVADVRPEPVHFHRRLHIMWPVPPTLRLTLFLIIA